MIHIDSLIREMSALMAFLATWISVFIGFTAVQEVVSLCASIAALILSVITARYYWIKTKKLKNEKSHDTTSS